MAIEPTVNFPVDLQHYYPLSGDAISEGDDQIRVLKYCVWNTFKALTSPVTVDHDQVNATEGCGNHSSGMTINERLERLEGGQNVANNVIWFSRHNDIPNDNPEHVYPENPGHFWGGRIQGATPEYALAMNLADGEGWVDMDRSIDDKGNAIFFKGSSLFLGRYGEEFEVLIGEYDPSAAVNTATEIGRCPFQVKSIWEGINEAVPIVTFSNLRAGQEMLVFNNNCTHWYEIFIQNAEPNQKIWHQSDYLDSVPQGGWVDTGRVTNGAGSAIIQMNSNKQFGDLEGDEYGNPYYRIAVQAAIPQNNSEAIGVVLVSLHGGPTVACLN
jgi:hypothetical protein